MSNKSEKPVKSPEPPLCPVCGSMATVHQAGPCLDRWVHVAFLGREPGKNSEVPPYSASPQQQCFGDVINAPRWPDSYAVIQTAYGCTVGRRISQSADTMEYEIVTSANNLPLAVCRAALCAISQTGNRPLMMT